MAFIEAAYINLLNPPFVGLNKAESFGKNKSLVSKCFSAHICTLSKRLLVSKNEKEPNTSNACITKSDLKEKKEKRC
jgi:hypothetical protein